MPSRATSSVSGLSRENGQAAVEIALVLPILLAILFGAIYLSRAFSYADQATQLAGQGARLAAVNSLPSGSSLSSYLLNTRAASQSTGFKNNLSSVCVSVPSAAKIGDPVTVTVNVKTVHIDLPLVGGKDLITSSKSATMRLEQTPTVITSSCSS
jgi:Flp pilus assembly protein TadG